MSIQQQPPQIQRGYVKQVLSGDLVVLRNQVQGTPKERTISLSNIIAPKLGRPVKDSTPTKDEPYAWKAREFLRKKLVGKLVCFTVARANASKDGALEKSQREYGTIYIGTDTTGENVAESLVSEGLVDVRKPSSRQNEALQRLYMLEDNAKANGKGKHGPNAQSHVRDIIWSVNEPQNFIDSLHHKPVKAIVEHVEDGSTVKLILLPTFHYIKMQMSGIRCRVSERTKTDGDQVNSKLNTYAEEARFFTELRLLQKDVEVILEGATFQLFFGTIIHPKGNIAELLLSEGLAECNNWQLSSVTGGPEKLQAAERKAKEKRLRRWESYSNESTIDTTKKDFQGKVAEICSSADSLILKLNNGSLKKIFLSSMKPPKRKEEDSTNETTNRRLPHNNPHVFQAREFLRKTLIGKVVNVTVDYVQPAKPEMDYPARTCCTVLIGGINVAKTLVSKGLATVVTHNKDDDQRSAYYSELNAAEAKAKKSLKGVHADDKKETSVHRGVVDLTGFSKNENQYVKSKQFLPFLQRAGRMESVVEFVASGSRFRMYVPRANCLLTFLLAGISCPKATRDTRNNESIQGEPWGDEALAYAKDTCLQREVEIEVESMDKIGNFIGWLWIENSNLSLALVREGFAEVHISAERSSHYRALQQAENDAKAKKIKMWEHYAPVDNEPKEEEVERKIDYKNVVVTDIRKDLRFFAQHHDEGSQLVEMLQQLRHDLSTNVPIPGSYRPKKGEICAALFSEDCLWYRAKVEKFDSKFVNILFIDYGNMEKAPITNLAALPSKYHSLPPAAHEYSLAFVTLPKDPESLEDAEVAFKDSACDSVVKLNVEYRSGSMQFVTLISPDDSKYDIGKELVESGFLYVDKNRKEKKFKKVINEYTTSQNAAKKGRLNLWRYGDTTEDDAKEFG